MRETLGILNTAIPQKYRQILQYRNHDHILFLLREIGPCVLSLQASRSFAQQYRNTAKKKSSNTAPPQYRVERVSEVLWFLIDKTRI